MSTEARDDFYHNYFLEPAQLLTSEEEQRLDQLKWTTTRMLLRMLLNNPGGRDTVLRFAQACMDTPPLMEQFDARDLYFHLRRDIKDLLPESPGAGSIRLLIGMISHGTSTGKLIRMINQANWPVTVSVGLAHVHLHRLGQPSHDKMGQAMLEWRKDLSEPAQITSTTLAKNLRHLLGRYIFSRDQLVLHNMRLVQKLSRDHATSTVSAADLAQEGLIGLIRAAEKFDYRRGFRFTTYAYNWINQQIKRACEGNGSLISYPVNVMQDVHRLHNAREELVKLRGFKPPLSAVIKNSGFSGEKVRQLSQITNLTVSIDSEEKYFDQDNLSLLEKIPDKTQIEPADQADKLILEEVTKASLSCLEARERFVVKARWGLSGCRQMSYREIAEHLKVSGEWARKLERCALEKLAGQDGLKDFYENQT